jgi:hypothetical protein
MQGGSSPRGVDIASIGLHANAIFRNGFKGDLPVQMANEKYFCFHQAQISCL